MNQKLSNLLMEEKRRTERLILRAEKELKRLPEGSLEGKRMRGKYLQFFHVFREDGKRVEKYIPKKNRKLAEQLAQKAYDQKVIKAGKSLRKELKRAEEAIRRYDPEGIYYTEVSVRQGLIQPLIPTDPQFVEQWYAEHPGGQNEFPKSVTYMTLRGEEVRSKSEKMIADTYFTAQIPYVYEPLLVLDGGKTAYPDFAVLNLQERKTIYHEHFGMMDDEEYRLRAIGKMREYNGYGFLQGVNMIYTFEGERISFDQNELNRIIRSFLTGEGS